MTARGRTPQLGSLRTPGNWKRARCVVIDTEITGRAEAVHTSDAGTMVERLTAIPPSSIAAVVNVHAAAPKTALQRQVERLARLADRGISRSTVLVHEDCRAALDALRGMLLDPEKASVLAALATEVAKESRVVNVGEVLKLSPFRYPGGKTWFVPEARRWLSRLARRPALFIEPFAGGASVGLAVAYEGLARHVILCEKDAEVVAVWKVALGEAKSVERLTRAILDFDCTRANVDARLAPSADASGDDVEAAFRTILRNRVSRGGNMSPGAGLIRAGDGGRGIAARWYPETISKRVETVHALRDRITFIEGDALDVIAAHGADSNAAFFLDPPYTSGPDSAGHRLYEQNHVSHPALFEAMATLAGPLLATYDDASTVRALALRHGLATSRVTMRSSHHRVRHELVITNGIGAIAGP